MNFKKIFSALALNTTFVMVAHAAPVYQCEVQFWDATKRVEVAQTRFSVEKTIRCPGYPNAVITRQAISLGQGRAPVYVSISEASCSVETPRQMEEYFIRADVMTAPDTFSTIAGAPVSSPTAELLAASQGFLLHFYCYPPAAAF